MKQVDGILRNAEKLELELRFNTSGFLGILVKVLGPMLKTASPSSAFITNQRVVKMTGKGDALDLDIDGIEMVYWNTSSDSFAVVAHDINQSLLLPRVVNAREVGEKLADMKVSLEKERMSPIRRFLR